MKIGILLSGRGSNMVNLVRSIKEKSIPATVEIVVSDRSDAPGLEKASGLGIPSLGIEAAKFSKREEHEKAVVAVLKDAGVELVCLCGYMRIVTPFFISSFKNRILNIHPSLLPMFPGLNSQKQAFDYGVKIAGATVHIVDEGVDTGPILLQGAVEVLEGESIETLSEKILEVEHRIYPVAVQACVERKVHVIGRRAWIRKERT